MKQLIFVLSLLVLGACGARVSSGGCACPGKDNKAVKIISKQEKAEGAMLFPVTVYTYDIGLLTYAQRAIDSLNSAFIGAGIQFELKSPKQFEFPEIEKLTARSYSQYYELSDLLDNKQELAIWIVPPGDVCDKNSCTATKGFSNINGTPSNIVVTDFGLYNTAVVVHEMGHWFGLSHTTDDDLEDTPYDPGSINSVYVSYDDCEMQHPKGYKPMLENFMAYYEYCPNKRKKYTPMQLSLMSNTAWNYKSQFIRK